MKNRELGFIAMSPMIYALIAAGIVILALTAWGFFERSRYMECQQTTVALTAQVKILADKLDTQSESIDRAAKGGQAAADAGAKLLAEARRLNTANAGALTRLEQQLAQAVPKRQDGKDKDCGDARKELREIKAGKGGKS